MIQFNKTFFQFTKRLALVVILMGVCNFAYAGGDAHNMITRHDSKVEARIDPSGIGKVYVVKEANKEEITSIPEGKGGNTSIAYDDCGYHTTQGSGWFGMDGSVKGISNMHDYFFFTELNEENEGKYLWGGWFEITVDENDAIESWKYKSSTQNGFQTTIEATQERTMTGWNKWSPYNEGGSKIDKRFAAHWIQPKVTDKGSDVNFETVDNPTLQPSKDAVFKVQHYLDASTFNLSTINTPFTPGDISLLLQEDEGYDGGETKTSYTIPITFTPQGYHNREHRQTITLSSTLAESLYTGDLEGKHHQTINLYAKEDYTPSISYDTKENKVYSKDYDFEEVAEGSLVATQAGDLMPKKWNYASQQATKADGKDCTIWKAWIVNNNTDGEEYFQINGDPIKDENGNVLYYSPANGDPIVSFSANAEGEYSATMYITCSYFDKAPIEVPSLETCTVQLSATVIKPTEAAIVYDPDELNFGNIIIAETPQQSTRVKAYLIDGDLTFKFIDGNVESDTHPIYEYNYENGYLHVGIREDADCSDDSKLETTLRVSGKGKDHGSTNIKTCSDDLTIKATSIALKTPTLTAYPGDGQVHLTWSSVPGATKGYRIEYTSDNGTGTYPTENDQYIENVTSQTITGLTNQIEYTFKLIAYSDHCSIEAQYQVKVTPIVPEITIDNSVRTGIFTGTTTGTTAQGFPYHTKREVNVSAAFANGMPIFDQLYIFGLTSSPNSNFAAEYAKTPVFVYNANGEKYELQKTNDSYTIENINTSAKSSYMTLTAENQKVYFAGYCPYASTGNTWADNGVVQINSNGSKTIDIYLDSLQLYAKPKTFEHKVETFNQLQELVLVDDNIYMQGSGSVFVFYGRTNDFRPNIHLRGNNTLQPAQSMELTLNYAIINNDKTIYSYIGTYTRQSSPIQCMPIGDNQKLTLTIDDVWSKISGTGTERTNGILEMKVKEENQPTGATVAPLIDLGNSETTLAIRGGHLKYSNTENTLVMGYRKITRSDDPGLGESFKTRYELYGAGDEATGSNKTGTDSGTFGLLDGGCVQFFDGTTTASNTTLNCPTNTTIDGGTFNCSIKAGSSENLKNTDNKALKLFTIQITEDYGEVKNHDTHITNIVTIKDFNKMMEDLFPDASVAEGNFVKPLSQYYANAAVKYGYASMQAKTIDGKDNIYLYLPYFEGTADVKRPWEMTGPIVTASAITADGEQSMNFGGVIQEMNEPIVKGDKEYEVTTSKMMYVEIDENTRQSIKYNYTFPGNVNASMDANALLHGSVAETDNYKVQDKIYMLLPVIAGQWKMIVPPFNVSNVYVIESYPEEQLLKDYGEQKTYSGWQITDPEKVIEARRAQSQRFMDFYALMYYNAEMIGVDDDIFTADGYGSFVMQWMTYEATRGKNGVQQEMNSNYLPVVQQLYHFTGYDGQYPEGMSWWNANYYLYKSESKTWEAKSEFVDGKEKVTFKTDWKEVTTQSAPRTSESHPVIMNMGEVYTMQFPAVVGTSHNDWNYWTGKYILLEGYGNGTEGINVLGANKALENIQIADPQKDKAHLGGNASFAQPTVSNDYLFCLEENENHVWDFARKNGTIDEEGEAVAPTKVLSPLEGFLLANVDSQPEQSTNEIGQTIETRKIAKAIRAESGEVIYEIQTKIIENDPGLGSGVPTIMNGMTLIVEPTSEGLTITPIKEQHVMLFDANGKMIFSKHLSAEENVTLPTGVYVVRGEYEQVKAIKK